MQWRLHYVVSIPFLLFSAACADSPMSPDISRSTLTTLEANAAIKGNGRTPGLVAFPCTFEIRDGAGAYRTRNAELYFPIADLHPNGTRRAYMYSAYAGDEPVRIALCFIPATDAAVRRMARTFNVEREARHSAIITMDGCVTEGECVLEEVDVTACVGGGDYPDCDSDNYEDYDACYDFGDCGGSGSWDWSNTGGTGGTGTPPAEPTAFDEGPLLWGACVLAVLGSAYTVDQVAGAFVDWWEAQQAYESASRMLTAIQANDDSVSPETIQLWQFRVQYARDRRDDALDDVSEKTGATGWALLGAAVACGAAAFIGP
jgi:hypothetical protein